MFLVWYFWKDYTNLNVSPFNLMFSAGHYWKRKKFSVPKLLPHKELFLDSGGYQLITKFKDYPFSVEDYMRYVVQVNPDYVATLDYPCDARFPSELSNKERIEKTVNNAETLLDYRLDNTVVPVFQGYSLSEYQYCLDLYKEKGLIQPLMGIGSVCIRKKRKEVKQIINLLAHQTNCKLHVFGLNLAFLKDPEIRRHVYSFDTFAWNIVSKFGQVQVFTGKCRKSLHSKNLLDDEERHFLSLRAILDYYDFLSEKWQQTNYGNSQEWSLDKFSEVSKC